MSAVRKTLPWPVLFAMYRAACAPRIYVRPGAEMTISWRGEIQIFPAHDGNPTIMVECGPNGTNPGALTLYALDRTSFFDDPDVNICGACGRCHKSPEMRCWTEKDIDAALAREAALKAQAANLETKLVGADARGNGIAKANDDLVGAIQRAGFRAALDLHDVPTLWCTACGRDSGLHHATCEKSS